MSGREAKTPEELEKAGREFITRSRGLLDAAEEALDTQCTPVSDNLIVAGVSIGTMALDGQDWVQELNALMGSGAV